ncbi:MAG: DUF5615 family PIN-like protein [Burkholderiales bacterium]
MGEILATEFPGSMHVHTAGLGETSDAAIWAYARSHGFVIASKDSDFFEMSVLLGAPPKLMWIRRGNCTTNQIAELMRANREVIDSLATHETARFLALD